MELGESSTSTARQDKRKRENAFDGIAPQTSSSSSTATKKGPWDVFINHRGCDVKHKLASTIYHTLDLLGLHAFLDVEKLELGDSIPDEIQEAMRTAALHISIFSKNYAQSPWCLTELSFMLKTGTPILPVFYHVQPTDLRWLAKGKGLYAPAFSDHKKKRRYPSRMLEEWKMALERVSHLSGHVLNSNNGDEGMLLKSIVNSVLRAMKKEPLEVAKHPVGMDEIVEDFERSRQEYIESEPQVQIVGIVGFGGCGKTTLATELYNRKSSSFHRSSFLHDVRDATSKNSLHTKQKKLLEDLRIQNVNTFDNVKEGTGIVADRLKTLRVLIVLDDVDHEDQLDALLPLKENLGSGSLVIVTTREGDVLTKWGITFIYKMRPLRHLHAKQLLCWHAFLQPFPQIGFEGLVEKCLHICNGLPLSLKVIGGQFYGKRSKDYWVSHLNKIQRILPKEIMQRLKVSYDALDEDEQEMFLDIACFFIGDRRSSAITVWDGSGWSGLCGWETLNNKCLVEVDDEECIRMHDHLRDLGREVAKTHSPSRFWSQRQSMHFQSGMPIRGIMAATDFCRGYMEMMTISNLRVGLQLLSVKENEFTQEFGELSRGFLWLRWFHFEHRYIPSWLSLENIRVLELIIPGRLQGLWEDSHPPLELRELLITRPIYFQSFPRSIGRLKHLKRLSLDCDFYGSRLSSLPEEFCQLHSLEHLDLRQCFSLSSLPIRFGDLANLRHINLSGCRSLEMLPVSFKQLMHLEYLNLSSCSKLSLESDILENITNLRVLDVSGCHELEILPLNITNQASLKELDLTDTSKLRELPARIDQLSELKMLTIGSCSFLTMLPTSLGNLSSLTVLTLNECSKLEFLPEEVGNLYNLQTLTIKRCPLLTRLPSLGNLSILTTLTLHSCDKLEYLPIELGQLSNLQILKIEMCALLTRLPPLGNLSSLAILRLYKCEMLESLPPDVGHLYNLQTLTIKGCPLLTGLPSLVNLSSLATLTLHGCEKLGSLSIEDGQLHNLQSLTIEGCPIFTRLPSLRNLPSLTTLTLHNCDKLESLPIEAKQLYSLQTLKIQGCPQLCEMSNLAGLVSLKDLYIQDCQKVKEIEGLENLRSIEKLIVRTCWMVPGIHSLRGTEKLRTLNLRADNISAFEPCIESIRMENWPWETTILARIFPGVHLILDSFSFPGLAVVNPWEINYVHTLDYNVDYDYNCKQCSLTCWETNLSNAAILCYLASSSGKYNQRVDIEGGRSTMVELNRGEWIVIIVFRDVSPLIKDGLHFIQASLKVYLCYPDIPHDVSGGWLIVGERGSVVEGFKQLFQTLCKAASRS